VLYPPGRGGIFIEMFIFLLFVIGCISDLHSNQYKSYKKATKITSKASGGSIVVHYYV